MNARHDHATLTEALLEGVNAEQSIGQIAVQLPGATAIFRRLKLDFCCSGQLSLRQATAEKCLDLDEVIAELSALRKTEISAAEVEPSVLIDHLKSRYHAVHREQLPELIRMARRVEAVHRENSLVPNGLAELLEGFQHELLSHMEKEEQVLFPLMLSNDSSFIRQPIALMRHEHSGHDLMLDCILALTNEATPPPGACNTWRALYAGIAQLNDDLINHIHLENNILFPQFESKATAEPAPTQGCGSVGCGCA